MKTLRKKYVREVQFDTHPDRGCEFATKYLIETTGDKNAQSHCLNCPFEHCIYDDNSLINKKFRHFPKDELEQIRELDKQKVRGVDIAVKFGTSSRTIHRIITGR